MSYATFTEIQHSYPRPHAPTCIASRLSGRLLPAFGMLVRLPKVTRTVSYIAWSVCCRRQSNTHFSAACLPAPPPPSPWQPCVKLGHSSRQRPRLACELAIGFSHPSPDALNNSQTANGGDHTWNSHPLSLSLSLDRRLRPGQASLIYRQCHAAATGDDSTERVSQRVTLPD